MGLNFSLSNVDYREIAPFVGLTPLLNFADVPSFDLHRSRIPTALLKDIVTDMDILLVQYGTMIDHTTEEARSRFLAPVSFLPELPHRIFLNILQIFNHLVAQFGRFIQNAPESLTNGCITTSETRFT